MATIDGDGGNNTLSGGSGDDVIHGFGGNDVLLGGDGSNLMNGGSGDDILVDNFGGSINTMIGGDGDDRLLALQGDSVDGGAGTDYIDLEFNESAVALKLNLKGLTSGGSLHLADGTSVTGIETGLIRFGMGDDRIKLGDADLDLYGGSGDDTLYGSHGNESLSGGLGDDLLNGGKGVDWVGYGDVATAVHVSLAIHGAQDTGGGGIDTLIGFENLYGTVNADTLTGDAHANVINGSIGADTLTGGKGADAFLYQSHSYSTAGAPDHITDLHKADVIDLSQMDADISTVSVNDAFHFVGAFTGHAAEAVLSFDGTDTRLSLDDNGDGAADSVIVMDGDHTDFAHFVL